MDVFDNSRTGNDCYIYEIWQWCRQINVAIKIQKFSHSDEISTSVFKHKEDSMPDTVMHWFE